MIKGGSIVSVVLVFVAACGGSNDDPYADADPRCAAACPIRVPDLEGAFEVCSGDSAKACVDQCEARIADVATVCATCLLDDVWFAPEARDSDDGCDEATCTISGYGGTCTYPVGDRVAHEACLRTAFPRREVACEVDFRLVTECSNVCV